MKTFASSLYLGISLALTASGGIAQAQQFPSKPIKLIVPFAPGGPNDILGRLVGQKLTEQWGQQVIVENRGGAGGTIGLEAAARLPKDGYGIAMGGTSNLAVAPSLYRKLGYDLAADFTPITLIASEALCATVHPSLPAKSVSEFVAFLKKRPGQVSYGSTGNGAVNHLATELFKTRAGVDMVHVPYKGSAFAIPDAISGLVPVLFANVTPLRPHIQSGRLRALAVTSRDRVRSLPEVPTIAESGYPGYEAINWFGLVTPTRTPDDVIRKLNASIKQAAALPDIRTQYESSGANQMIGTPEDMRVFLQSETSKWAAVVKTSGARID